MDGKATRCLAKRLLGDFWGTLADWEAHRPLWLLGAISGLAFEVFSYLYYQQHLGLRPCYYCVLIRAAMWGVALGGLLGAIWPKRLLPKLPGYIVALVSSAWGLKLSVDLEFINLGVAACPLGGVPFPFGLPLDGWFPAHFKPTGICGVDGKWSFLDFSMTQLLIMIFIVYIIGLVLMLSARLYANASAKKEKAPRNPAGEGGEA
jgi:disulfide bond formation protein DsbB